MAFTTRTITGNVADLLGNNYAGTGTDKMTLKLTSSEALVNDGGSMVRVGGTEPVTVGADGAVSIAVPATGEDGPLYRLTVDAPELRAAGFRAGFATGWFDLAQNRTLGEIVAASVEPSDAMVSIINPTTDHGDVTGTLTVSGGTHTFDIDGNVTVTVYGDRDATLSVYGTGTVTVSGEEFDIEEHAVIVVFSDSRAQYAYMAGGGSGEPVIPDTTPPSAITDLTATGGQGTLSFTWTARTDAESAVHYRYRYYLTSAGSSGASWVNTDATTVNLSGVPSGAYTVDVYAYSQGGSSATDSATATVTAPLTVDFLDTFTRSNGQLASATNPDTGGAWSGSTAGPQINNGKLTSAGGETVYASRGSNPAREITADITTTSASTIVLTAWSASGALDGPRLAILTNGQVSFQNISNVSFNVTGGSNPYTPTGYLSYGAHTIRVVTNVDGTCHAYIDGTLVVSAEYNTSLTGRHVGLSLLGTIDNIQVKS